jgi:hypothetical protein
MAGIMGADGAPPGVGGGQATPGVVNQEFVRALGGAAERQRDAAHRRARRKACLLVCRSPGRVRAAHAR